MNDGGMSFDGLAARSKRRPEVDPVEDKIAAVHGFVSREPRRQPPRRRRGTSADSDLFNMTMRLDMDSADKFIRWCERMRLTYREGFDRLVRQIDENDRAD